MSQALAGTAAAVDALMAFVRCKMESPSRSTTVRGSAAVTEGCRPSVGGSIGNPARHGETLCRHRQAFPLKDGFEDKFAAFRSVEDAYFVTTSYLLTHDECFAS